MTWHGINAAALRARAQRDGIPVDDGVEVAALAEAILGTVTSLPAPVAHWDLATGM
jgi:hypothetical protein